MKTTIDNKICKYTTDSIFLSGINYLVVGNRIFLIVCNLLYYIIDYRTPSKPKI